MSFATPDTNGWVKFPAAAAAAAAVEEWTDVDLTTSNFHITAREGATELDKWTISNPTATSMRLLRLSSDVANWNPGSSPAEHYQRGPAIIFKTQMDPRPLAAHALDGVTDNRWRHGECQLTVAMRLSVPSRPGGHGHAIGVGVGSFSARMTSAAGPPWLRRIRPLRSWAAGHRRTSDT